MKKLILTTIALAILCCYFYYTSNNVEEKSDTLLVVGTCADYPPYEKIDFATGTIIGFDIDVITEVARRLNKKIQLKDMPFNSLMLNLVAGQIDLIAAGLSETPERKQAILFSDVYLDNDYMVIVSNADTPPLQSIQDLYGKTVAVNTGYSAETYLANIPEINLIRFDSTAESALALQTNNVYAFATSKSSYTIFIEQQTTQHKYQYFIIPEVTEQCAFAFKKNNSTLKEKIDSILDTMKKDGTLQAIKNSWGFHD